MPTTNTDTRHLGCGCGTSEATLHAVWLKTEDGKLTGQNRKRRYLHFDKRIGKVKDEVSQDVWNPKVVAKHSFLPLIKVVIEERRFKKEWKLLGMYPIHKKPRDIAYASHFDALIFSWYAFLLNHFYNHYLIEKGLDDVVIAYRENKPGKNNLYFAKEVIDFVKSKEEVVVVCFDIKGFFDNLDHSELKLAWKEILSVGSASGTLPLPEDHYNVYWAIKNYARVGRDELYERFGIKIKELRKHQIVCTPKELIAKGKDLITINPNPFGIPQGSPISAVLSNLYMRNFDQVINTAVTEQGGLYRRYSDDILVAVPKKYLAELTAIIEKQIQESKLEIQPEKTSTSFFAKKKDSYLECTDATGKPTKLSYLGVEFDGIRIDVKHRSFARYQRRRMSAIKREFYKSKKNKSPLDRGRLLAKYSVTSVQNFVEYMRRAEGIFHSDPLKKKTSYSQTTGKLTSLIKKIRNK